MVKNPKFSSCGNSSQHGCSVASLFNRFSFALLSDSVNNVLLIILNIRTYWRSTFFNIIVGKLRGRLRERRKQRASRIFFVSLSLFFPGQRVVLLSRALCLFRLRNVSSNHSKARVVWYPRLSENVASQSLIIAERAPREERGNHHPLSHQIVLLLQE